MTSPLKEHKKTLKTVRDVLKRHKIKHKFMNRDKAKKTHFKNKDVIITIGGDGTLLRISHKVFDKTPIWGINSDIYHKEGFFMQTNRYNFEKHLKKLLKGEQHIKQLTRLETRINNKKIKDLALNDVYIGRIKAYLLSRYWIKIGKRQEKQKSSGVIVSTAAGSHAWLRSTGGELMQIESRKMQYIIREPYIGALIKPKMLKGITKTIIIKTFLESTVVIDSLSKEYKIRKGDKVEVRAAKKPINIIFFHNKQWKGLSE